MVAAASVTAPAATKFLPLRTQPKQKRCGDEDTKVKKCMRDNDMDIRRGFGMGYMVVASLASFMMAHSLLPTTTWKVVSSQLDPMQISCSYTGVADSLG